MISNKDILRYGNATKLDLTPTEYGARSSVFISSFKVNEYGNCEMDNEHNYGAR